MHLLQVTRDGVVDMGSDERMTISPKTRKSKAVLISLSSCSAHQTFGGNRTRAIKLISIGMSIEIIIPDHINLGEERKLCDETASI